jgi:hypothetical protein
MHKKMNLSKIKYWNELRKDLNKWILLLGVFLLIIVAVFYDNNDSLNFFISNPKFSLTVYTLLNFLIYLAFVNTFLLVLEMIDRTINFQERNNLKRYFRWIILLIFIGVLVVQLTLLLTNKIN